MKKRTIALGMILASAAQANPTQADAYLESNTGVNQPQVNELCLKVQTYSIVSWTPDGVASSPIGLQVASAEPLDLVIEEDFKTKTCPTGYIKIQTTAPLLSIRNAPVGL